MPKRTILIIASNPSNTVRLRLGAEIKAIQDILRSTDHQQQFSFKIEPAATIKSLSTAFVRDKPEIVHFSGHGDGEKGLCLETDNGQKQLLSTESLADIFKLTKDYVRCVVLNACYSEVQAKAILPYVDCVIGMSDQINDNTAIEFAETFYRNLASAESYEQSFEWAKTSIKAHNLPSLHVPTIHHNKKTRSFELNEDEPTSLTTSPKDKIAPQSPFLVIPTSTQRPITADKHYFEIQHYLDAHWGLVSLPRIKSTRELQDALEIEEPNFIYFYAAIEHENIYLDDDILDLSVLADKLQRQGLRPIIILVLVGDVSNLDIPEKLQQQTRLIWCLNAKHSRNIDKLTNQIINMIEQVPQKPDTDVASLIETLIISKRGIQSQLYSPNKQLHIAVDAQSQRKQQQFRAALLRIMLGRVELKGHISSSIIKHLEKSGVLTYAVTGTQLSCVFELPHQIEHWMRPQLMNNQGVVLINHPLHLYIHAGQDEDEVEANIYDVIDQAIPHDSQKLEAQIEKQLRHKGGKSQDCGMVFQWNIQIDDDVSESEFAEWLDVWHEISDDDFGDINIPNAILIHALCFQTKEQQQADKTHKQAQKFIRTTVAKSSRKKDLRIKHTLGVLQEDDIDEFFSNDSNAHWKEYFQFEAYNIDSYELAEWICEKTGGEFNKVVDMLWKEQQHNYRDYLS